MAATPAVMAGLAAMFSAVRLCQGVRTDSDDATKADYTAMPEHKCMEDSLKFATPQDPEQLGFPHWKRNDDVSWSMKQGLTAAVKIEEECFGACMAMPYCNYVMVAKQSQEGTCEFYTTCVLQPQGDATDLVLQREDDAKNVYWFPSRPEGYSKTSYTQVMQHGLAEFHKEVEGLGQFQKPKVVWKYKELMRPHNEMEYAYWFEHIRQTNNTATWYKHGRPTNLEPSGVSIIPGSPDVVTKSEVPQDERELQTKAVSDLDAVLQALASAGVARHLKVLPAIPRVLFEESGAEDELKMDRIYPSFGANPDLEKDLDPEPLTDDVPINRLSYARRVKSHPAVQYIHWLQQVLVSEDPLLDIAFSKGVLDASLDCVTHVGGSTGDTGEGVPVQRILGRDKKKGIKLFAIGWSHKTDRAKYGWKYDWCAALLTDVPVLPRNVGAAVKAYPDPVSNNDGQAYLDGYNAVLQHYVHA